MLESEDGFDKMDTGEDDKVNDDAATEPDKQSTPEPLEDDTATDGEDGHGTESIPPALKTTKPQTAKQVGTTRNASKPSTAEPPSPVPPRRELPFTRRSKGYKPAPTEKQLAQSDPNIGGYKKEADNETDDDEL
jgi:hypothetical protein